MREVGAANSTSNLALPPRPFELESAFDILPPWLKKIIEEEGRLVLRDVEVGRLLGVSRGSVRQAIRLEQIHAVHLNRRLLIPIIPLLEMIGLDHGRED